VKKNNSLIGKPQLLLILIFTILFSILYFGLDRKPKKQALVENSRAANAEVTDPTILIREAKELLKDEQAAYIQVLESDLRSNQDDPQPILESLAARWFEAGYPAISGYYAEEIAKLLNTEEAWSIAGTTFTMALKGENSEKVRAYCSQHALSAFEKTISLSPDNVDHRINQALVYIDYPAKDNPMKGIQMLLGLKDKYPENASVLIQLGRLAIGTRQYERAIERLNTALTIDKDNDKANCLLAQAYQATGDIVNARLFNDKCLQKI